MLRQAEVRSDFVELHRLDAGRLVFAGRDHAVLDGVVDFIAGDHGRAMPTAANVFDQIGAPCTRTLRPLRSARFLSGLLAKMLRMPPPA